MAESDWEDYKERVEGVVSKADDARGHFSSKYDFHYPENGPTTVEILTKKESRAHAGGHPGGESVCRANNPTGGVRDPHISINPKRAGTTNPHVNIPHGAPEAARFGSKAAQTVGKGVKYASPAFDVGNTLHSGYKDYQRGTTRNTVETVSGIGGGTFGADAGGWLGAQIGSRIGGPFGALLGGICGAVGGGIAGSYAAETTAEAIGDRCNYDTEIRICKRCGNQFMVRKYRGEQDKLCPSCRRD